MPRKRRFKWIDQGSLKYLTLGGKVLGGVLLFSLHGAISLESPLIQLFAAVLALLLVALGVGLLFRPRLHAQLGSAAVTSCDEPLELTVQLRHATRRAFDLLVELDEVPGSWSWDRRPARVAAIRPGQSVVVPLVVHPTRRGVFPLPDVRVTSTFPFNLFRFRRGFSNAGEVTVTPAYQPLARFDVLQRLGGAHVEQLTGSRTGGSEDYLGNREYRPGIAVRRWDYCSWARLGRPVVREYENEGRMTATLVVDTFRENPPRPEAVQPEFEALLSLAAALSDALARDACRVSTLVVGTELISPVGLSLMDQHDVILRTLATAQPTAADRLPELLEELAAREAQPDLVFLLSNVWNRQSGEWTRVLNREGNHVCPVVVGNEAANLPSGVRWVSPAAIAAGEVELP